VKLLLPTDIVVAPAFSADATPTLVAADAIPTDQMGLDIGPVSAAAFAAEIKSARQYFGMAQWASLNFLTLLPVPK
jgi:phosphoglycerate kinase